MEKNALQLHFGGESHSINAHTLIKTLEQYNALVSIINQEFGGGAKEISVQVNAPRRGSFILDINLIEGISNIFSSDSVSYISDLLGILGGIYATYKAFKGKPAKKSDIENQINININNTQINNHIVNLYNDRRTREAISNTFETLDQDNCVDDFNLIWEAGELETKREEFKDLIYNDFDRERLKPEELVVEEDATLVIIALNFEKGSKWTFLHKGQRFNMPVKDDALMQQIEKGMQFGKGDAIKVRLQITKRFNPEYGVYEICSRRISVFYQLIKREFVDPIAIDGQ